jgi:hypothetical protein
LFQTQEKQRQLESEINEKESKALRRRLAMVEQERSSDRLIEDIERLKKLGLYPTGNPSNQQSLEAIKLQTDLDRWKFERQTDMERWQLQQEMDTRKWYKEREMEEDRERRTQERLGVVGNTLKDTLQTVVTPLLSSMSAGVAQGMQPQAQSTQPPDFSVYDDQTLLQQYQETERVGGKVSEAQSLLRAEIEKRTRAAQARIANQPAPITAAPKPQKGIDLGSMADLQFSVAPSSPPKDDYDEYEDEDDDEYEHVEELANLAGEDDQDAYDIEY